ncbi:MAG: hypothetical protein ACKVJQ_03345 [Alphaproteobacteria bacterium]|jgi:CRISPR-associated endonuclease Cas2
MAVLLVTYDLNKETKRPNIVKAVKNISNDCVQLSESSYAVKTNKSPNTVFIELKKYIDDNDSLFIITLRKPHAGYGLSDAIDWLEKNLPE